MFEDENGYKLPVIFPDNMIHAEVSEHIQFMMHRSDSSPGPVRPVSAGSISLFAMCSGHSETLKLSSRENDSMFVTYNDSLKYLSSGDITDGMKDMLMRKLNSKFNQR